MRKKNHWTKLRDRRETRTMTLRNREICKVIEGWDLQSNAEKYKDSDRNWKRLRKEQSRTKGTKKGHRGKESKRINRGRDSGKQKKLLETTRCTVRCSTGITFIHHKWSVVQISWNRLFKQKMVLNFVVSWILIFFLYWLIGGF